ncbi:helix-turn-helix domain-containing protein [Dyella marensis]|uniref:helix-turn-helix domain-containing protein n=1 Tax=Dyella marensis TaxID=500610 RepID=UPI0031E03C8A
MAMGYDAEVLHNLKDTPHSGSMQHNMNGKKPIRVISPIELSADEIIVRMRQVVGVKTDAGLSTALGLGGASTPSNWRNRNSPPFAYCANIAAALGVSMDWLVLGRHRHAESASTGTPDRGGSASVPMASTPSAERITRFVNEWEATRSPEEVIWLEQHLKRTVPEYSEWLANQQAG